MPPSLTLLPSPLPPLPPGVSFIALVVSSPSPIHYTSGDLPTAAQAEPASVHVSEDRQICHVSEEGQVEAARLASLMQAGHYEYFASL